MQNIPGFTQRGRYYDDKNFPKGFHRSGEFTVNEADLLFNYGKELAALEAGTLVPENDQQKHFIAVCTGEAEAETALELAWQKYRRKALARRSAISAFSSARPVIEEEITDDEEEDELLLDDMDE